MEIYIGAASSDLDLTLAGSPSGLWIKPVPADHYSRPLIELESVFEVGSFMGCACGLGFDDATRDDEHERRVENVVALREILKANAGEIVRILSLNEFNRGSLEEFPRRILDLDAMDESVAEFWFEDDSVYEIWPPGTPGPAKIKELFKPVKLGADEIGGIAPEVEGYWRDFAGKGWDEITEERYRWHNDVFNLMNLETLRHFIAGYLMAALEPSGSDVRWSIQCFSARDGFRELHDLLEPEQQKFFLGVIDFMMRSEDVDDDARSAYDAQRRLLQKPSP